MTTQLHSLHTAEQVPTGSGHVVVADDPTVRAVAGWQVVGVANLVVPVGEIVVLVVQDWAGRRRAVYWDRNTHRMVAPLVDSIVGAPGEGVVWSADRFPPPPPWYMR